VDACAGVLDGSIRGFISLGGNFARATPEQTLMQPAWRKLQINVLIATKLNRSALLPGQVSYVLPCLGRIEKDLQANGPQAVSMEDSTACIHGSRGQREPVSDTLRSEPKIIAEIAKATLSASPNVPWDRWVADYALVRDAIERTYPDQFQDFNKRMFTPGGFPRPLPARERKWKTPTGKANFTVPKALEESVPEGAFKLMTTRSDGQFNTTIYNLDDRLRGIHGSRNVILMNPVDMERLGIQSDDHITLITAAHDGIERKLYNMQVIPYDIPLNCLAGFYPECNLLIPLWHYAEESKVPAAKSIPVRVQKSRNGNAAHA
jgi:molybdopterin-dependent oxidoreductase alpha subunit